jgi:hypothetical protein
MRIEMFERERWAGSTHERCNKLRLRRHEESVVGVVCGGVTKVGDIATRGVAFLSFKAPLKLS